MVGGEGWSEVGFRLVFLPSSKKLIKIYTLPSKNLKECRKQQRHRPPSLAAPSASARPIKPAFSSGPHSSACARCLPKRNTPIQPHNPFAKPPRTSIGSSASSSRSSSSRSCTPSTARTPGSSGTPCPMQPLQVKVEVQTIGLVARH